MIMYTSGTTGRPKGAMLTHGNFWWNNINSLHGADTLQDDVTLTSAPIFHIGGLNVTTLVTLQKGGLVVLHRGFDPGHALAAIAEHRKLAALCERGDAEGASAALIKHLDAAQAAMRTARPAAAGKVSRGKN